MAELFKRVRRITGYGCDGAVILYQDVPIDPPECYGEDPEATIAWIASYYGVEKVTDQFRAIYPTESASNGPQS